MLGRICHYKKLIQPYFNLMLDGTKTFDVRKCSSMENSYKVGDYIVFLEYDTVKGFSGRGIYSIVSYIQTLSIDCDYVILGLKDIQQDNYTTEQAQKRHLHSQKIHERK